jgi:hypothetical protein
LVFLFFALSELTAQELRVVVVDVSAKQVAVPVWVFDTTGKLVQEISSKHSGEAPLALMPGTYTIAITENERQQVRLESGESLRLVLGRNTLALPLEGPGQQRPWQSFDLIAPLYHHPQGFPVLMGDNESVLEYDELFAIASDGIKQALTLARELNKAEEKTWETYLLAVQTLAELGARNVVPDLQAVLEQSASGWLKIDMQAARGLVRLLAAADTRALFRRIFIAGSPRAQQAAATVAAVENLLDPQEFLPVLRVLLQDRSARQQVWLLLISLDLPPAHLQALADELAVYEPPHTYDKLAFLFGLAAHGDGRALGMLRELLHRPEVGHVAREFLIRLVAQPTPLIEAGIVVKPRLENGEWQSTRAALRSLPLTGWRRVAPVVGLLRDVVDTSNELRVLKYAVPLLTGQYDVSGIFRLVTANATDAGAATEIALLLMNSGVGSHLQLVEQALERSVAGFTAAVLKDKQDDLLRVIRQQTEALGKVMAATHQADAQRAQDILKGYLEHRHPAVRLLALRGLLFGTQAQHRKRAERGSVQSDLFYHYSRQGNKVSMFAPLFLAQAPRASLASDKLRIELDRVIDKQCYDPGGGFLAGATCLEIEEKPMWDGPPWPVTGVTVVDPDGRRYRLSIRSLDSGKLIAEFTPETGHGADAWNGWLLEIAVSYMDHGRRTYRFDLTTLFR